MNFDDFEQRLRRQPVKRVPAEWRERILSAAQTAGSPSEARSRAVLTPSWRLWLSSLLWPSPKAWASLAVVWLGIVIFNLSIGDHTQRIARRTPSPEVFMAFREQERLLTELLRSSAPPPESEPPKPATPQPQSQRREETAAV